jgi:hypothetical protein
VRGELDDLLLEPLDRKARGIARIRRLRFRGTAWEVCFTYEHMFDGTPPLGRKWGST